MSAIDPDALPRRQRATSCHGASADDHREALEALSLVAALPQRKRRFLAAKVAGYSYDEIAGQLGVSYTNVNRHLVRARSAVRAARDRY
jgi:DNA-directed RNA polymerase specialized sigma24 family protein